MDRLEKACIEKGMRMTDQRRVIARVLSSAEDHPDVEELHRRAHAIDPHISIATVYRTVRLFEESGIIERHDFRDGRSRYEETPDHHHDHLIDMKTGKVVEFVDEEIAHAQLVSRLARLRDTVWEAVMFKEFDKLEHIARCLSKTKPTGQHWRRQVLDI